MKRLSAVVSVVDRIVSAADTPSQLQVRASIEWCALSLRTGGDNGSYYPYRKLIYKFYLTMNTIRTRVTISLKPTKNDQKVFFFQS